MYVYGIIIPVEGAGGNVNVREGKENTRGSILPFDPKQNDSLDV
jgi:hypothetical protein